jgi:hypothetical protein
MEIRMRPDPEAEAVMREIRVQFRVEPAFPLELIDEAGSGQWQIRPAGSVNADVALRYQEAMVQGAAFPYVVVYEDRGTGLPGRLVSGAHRTAAARAAGVAQVGAYVITRADPIQIEELMVRLNATHGHQLSAGDVELLILRLLDAYPRLTDGEVARWFGNAVLTSRVVSLRRRRTVQRRLVDRGVLYDQLHESAMEQLYPLEYDESLAAAANLAIDAGLTVQDVQGLVREMGDHGTAANQLGVVDAWRERDDIRRQIDARDRGDARPRRTAIEDLLRQLRTVNRSLHRVAPEIIAASATEAQLTEAVDLLTQISRKIYVVTNDDRAE